MAQTGRLCTFPGSVACVQRQAAGPRTPARWATITIKGEHTGPKHALLNPGYVARPFAPSDDFSQLHQRDLACPVGSRKIFRFRCRANQFYQFAPSHPPRGADRESSRTRDGMRWTRQRWRETAIAGRISVSDRSVRRRTALQRLGWNSSDSTWSAAVLVEVAAYGEVVWSWHPLLMLSPRRRVGPTGLEQAISARRR
jgi:hypothetical protein